MREAVRARYTERARSLPQSADGEPPSLGVGDPVALAELRDGETVLDLGSGPGRDLLAAARRVGAAGRAIGVDMTQAMLERGRRAAADAGLDNVSVLDGDLEALPVPCGVIDVIVSNCVINLVEDKRRALVEAYRVLAPGGRLAVVDTAFEAEPPAALRADADSWACCVGGALVVEDYARLLEEVGFVDVRVELTDATCAEDCSSVRSAAVTARKAGTGGGDVVLRPAVPSDRPAVLELLAGTGISPDDLRTEDMVVGLEGREVVGVVALERYGDAALLRSLAVRPDRRRDGLGTRLVFAALEVARWSRAEDVFLLTEDARGFFERVGFASVERAIAAAALDAPQLNTPACAAATAMRLRFEEAPLPLLGRPSRKPLPVFDGGSCC